MRIFPAIVAVLLGLALLAALGVGAYWAIAWVVGLFGTLEPQVAALTGILSVLALLAAMILAGGPGRAGRHAIAGQLHAEEKEWGQEKEWVVQVLHSSMSYRHPAPVLCRAVRCRDVGNRASTRDGVTGQDDHRTVAWTKMAESAMRNWKR